MLAFSTSIATEMPDLTWQEFRNVLLANGHGFCGYGEEVVKRAFERGRKGVYGEMCRDPSLCAGKGYCPRDPTCAD